MQKSTDFIQPTRRKIRIKKKFVVQIVSKEWSTDDTCYRDVENGGFDTRDQAELLIEELIYKVPCYDYRIDERYVR